MRDLVSTVRSIATAVLALICLTALVGWTDGAAASPARSPKCTITGTAGDDVLVGTRHRDVICGLGGNDTIRAGRGDDVVLGGDGDDVLHGGPGDDVVAGGPGHDVLNGDRGADRLVGPNPVWDVCPFDAADTLRKGCQFDHSPPEIVSLTSTPASVDVSKAAQTVTVRLHARDDTEIRRPGDSTTPGGGWSLVGGGQSDSPRLALSRFRLVSGDRHDGEWSATVTVPRGFPVADLAVEDEVCDIDYRCTGDGSPILHVADATPDTTGPTVSLLAPREHSGRVALNVRHKARNLQVRTRVADAGSGTSSVRLCLTRPSSDPEPEILWLPQLCQSAHLVSGDRHRGVWQASLHVARGTNSGDACVWVGAADRAQPLQRTTYSCAATRDDHPFPGRRGYVEIVGHGSTKVPVLDSYQQTPTEVSAAQPAVQVSFKVLDASPVQATVVDFWSAETGLHFHQFIELTGGAERDGTWTGTVGVGNLPPGTYYPIVTVADGAHVTSYAGAQIATRLNLFTRRMPAGSHPVSVTGP